MQSHVILLDGPLAGQRVHSPLKRENYEHRDPATGVTTVYRLGFTVMFRCHLRVGWTGHDREPDALDCARWLTSEVVKAQLDDLWRGSGVGALTRDARVARAEYEANAAIPPLDPPPGRDDLAEAIRRAERYVQARRRAAQGGVWTQTHQDGVVADALVLDDGPEEGQGFTPLREDDLVKLIAAARSAALSVEATGA
jgi:hypothetical protein